MKVLYETFYIDQDQLVKRKFGIFSVTFPMLSQLVGINVTLQIKSDVMSFIHGKLANNFGTCKAALQSIKSEMCLDLEILLLFSY